MGLEESTIEGGKKVKPSEQRFGKIDFFSTDYSGINFDSCSKSSGNLNHQLFLKDFLCLELGQTVIFFLSLESSIILKNEKKNDGDTLKKIGPLVPHRLLVPSFFFFSFSILFQWWWKNMHCRKKYLL